MNFTEAREYIRRHDKRVKELHRKTIPVLKEFYVQGLMAAGQTPIFGGPVTRDEFIHAILELEYPDIEKARAAYSDGWSFPTTTKDE